MRIKDDATKEIYDGKSSKKARARLPEELWVLARKNAPLAGQVSRQEDIEIVDYHWVPVSGCRSEIATSTTINEKVTMIPKNRPPTHPGVLIQDTIQELGITQVEIAKRLGIPLQRLNTIVKGKRGVTADTALRLSKVFGTTPELWLNLQMAVDLWEAQKAANLSGLKAIQKRAA
jgi:addiction module HigA family antidote